ncbi:hypothetical protein MTP99_005941 [Tenebrio molitor]|nr:hypothetical protein MTP99_005941 [Tenebrio molitor]
MCNTRVHILFAAEQSIVNTDQVLEETDDKLNDAFNNLDTQVRGALKSVQERANNAETQSENMRKTAHEAREIVDKLERGADALTRKADDAKNRSIEAYEIAKKAITKQNNITKKNDCCESSSIIDRAEEAKKNVLVLLNEANNLVIPEVDMPKLKEKAAELKLGAQQLRNETERIVKESRDLVAKIQEQFYVGRDLLENSEAQQEDINDVLLEIHLYKSQAEKAVEMGNNILNTTKETYNVLTNFDKQVEDSKSASEKALQEIGEIEDIILEAFDNTTKARGTLGEAKRNADEALQKALQAEELASYRHRYEVNPKYIEEIEKQGLKFVEVDIDAERMEILELPSHPYYVAVQFHPEYLSRPVDPSPPFMGLILAAKDRLNSYFARACITSKACLHFFIVV